MDIASTVQDANQFNSVRQRPIESREAVFFAFGIVALAGKEWIGIGALPLFEPYLTSLTRRWRTFAGVLDALQTRARHMRRPSHLPSKIRKRRFLARRLAEVKDGDEDGEGAAIDAEQ